VGGSSITMKEFAVRLVEVLGRGIGMIRIMMGTRVTRTALKARSSADQPSFSDECRKQTRRQALKDSRGASGNFELPPRGRPTIARRLMGTNDGARRGE
jgi:hypothetical protein